MPAFKVLILKEHVHGEIHKLDHRMCILYDETEGKFFYYGTRNNEDQTKYIYYKGTYHYTQKDEMLSFLSFIMGGFEEVMTTELHMVYIHENEYSDLNYLRLISKMDDTLLSAYDEVLLSKESIGEYLSFL
jgi:hypothetical protein